MDKTPVVARLVYYCPIVAVNQTDTFRLGSEGKSGPTADRLTVNNPTAKRFKEDNGGC